MVSSQMKKYHLFYPQGTLQNMSQSVLYFQRTLVTTSSLVVSSFVRCYHRTNRQSPFSTE